MLLSIKRLGLALVIALSVATLALANEGSDKLSRIVEQQRALRGDLDSGKAEGMTARQVRVIRASQDEVFSLAQGKSSLDELNIEERTQLENALERINANFVGTRQAQEGQEVCWSEAKTGSKMKVTRCGTQEERDLAREGARAWMAKPKICIPPGCGG